MTRDEFFYDGLHNAYGMKNQVQLKRGPSASRFNKYPPLREKSAPHCIHTTEACRESENSIDQRPVSHSVV